MLQHKKKIVFRFNHETPINLPLAVRSCGTYSLVPHLPPEPPFQKWFCEIFWSVKGSGEFELDGSKIVVKENEIFYHLPGEIHTIRPLTTPWTYHWLTLDHNLAPKWLETFGFLKRPFPANHCPTALFKSLQASLREGTLQGERRASHLAHAILLSATEKIYTRSESRNTLCQECKRIMDNHYIEPQLNINTIATKLRVHRATLFRSFLTAYGITPSHYLQSRRLHHAIELLKQGNLQVQEVTVQVGMTDPNYLTRLIRKVTGMSPQLLRSRLTKTHRRTKKPESF